MDQMEGFLDYATDPLAAWQAVREGKGKEGQMLGMAQRVAMAVALVISLFLLYWLFMVVWSNTMGRLNVALPGIYAGKSGFKGGNFSTAGNSPLWEGGSLSDQANLAVDPYYANSALVGATGWAEPRACGSAASARSVGEATRGQIMQSIPGAASDAGCGAARLSDAALAKLAQ